MSSPALNTLGNRLGHLIAIAKLDAQDVDDLAGLKSHGHVAAIVRGAKKKPSAATVVALARVLGTTAEWLVEGSKDSAPSERRVRAAVRAAQAGAGAHAPSKTRRSRARN